MSGRLCGKTIVVTGGLSGIGAATCEILAREGAHVVAADLSADTTTLANDRIATIKVDVSDQRSVEDAIDAITKRDGRIDGLVNSAGIAAATPFLDTTIETFDRIMAVNLRGSFLVGQTVARVMARTGGGSIVNIGSISGLIGSANRSAYGASKGGVAILSKVMATDLAQFGIRVNVIAPGPINTPLVLSAETRLEYESMVSLRRYGEPAEVANAALFLLSDESSYITGQVLAVDGGFTAQGLPAPWVAR